MKIACIGNVVCDCTVSGNEFIKEGIRNSFCDAEYTVGGPASNAASVIAKYGSDVHFYGQVGNDSNGDFVKKQMELETIKLKHLVISKRIMTPFSYVIINKSNSSRTICTNRSKEDYENAKIDNIRYEVKYNYILTDGKYADESINLIKLNPFATSIIDAGRVNENVLRVCEKVNYIICSEDFAKGVTGIEFNDNYSNSYEIYTKLKERFKNAKGIVITIGERGYIYERDNEVLINPAYQSGLPAIDTNCAGDIFHGAFTYAFANGYDYYDALEFANITASLSTTRKGGRSSCPEKEEVEAILTEKQKQLIK